MIRVGVIVLLEVVKKGWYKVVRSVGGGGEIRKLVS